MIDVYKRQGEKLVYTGSLLGQNMIYSFVAMYVMFFFTDLLRIPYQSVKMCIRDRPWIMGNWIPSISLRRIVPTSFIVSAARRPR